MIINPYRFGIAQLINEQFESPGATGWTSNTTSPNLAWSDQYVTSPAPLVGSYSARIQATATTPNQVNAQKTFTASGTVYCRFRINHQRATSGNGTLASMRDSAGNVLASFGLINATNASRAVPTGGTTISGSAPTLSTTYYGWFEYEKGTGVNAVCRVGYSVTSTRPTTWTGLLAASTNGTATANADRIMFGTTSAATNYDVIIDDIQIQSTPFP